MQRSVEMDELRLHTIVRYLVSFHVRSLSGGVEADRLRAAGSAVMGLLTPGEQVVVERVAETMAEQPIDINLAYRRLIQLGADIMADPAHGRAVMKRHFERRAEPVSPA